MRTPLTVSYLFRSLGGVIGVSLGNNIEQQILRWNLERLLKGENTEEVSHPQRQNLLTLTPSLHLARSFSVLENHSSILILLSQKNKSW